MINEIIRMFSYTFIIKAFITGLLVSLCASLIGVTLVLRKNSMIGDGLSHVAFGSFALATVFGFAPLYFTIPIVMIASFFILKISDNSKISGDSLIAIISTSALAIGTFLVSINGVNTDINNYLFGSILSIGDSELIISIILSIVVILLYIVSYNKIFAITFDQKFAKSIGINTNFYNIVFALLCSIVVVLGMRVMGSLLISSLIIFPTISSMQVFKKFKSVVISSVIVSIISFSIGLFISYFYETPTGSTIVIINLFFLIIFKFLSLIIYKDKK